MSTKIFLYDTTLRDGAQSEDVNLSATDKVRIARQLDYLGMDYIEGGWPGANPVETEFFNAMRGVGLRNAKLAAFGSTHHPSHTPETDPTLAALISSGARVAAVLGNPAPAMWKWPWAFPGNAIWKSSAIPFPSLRKIWKKPF